MFVISDLGGPLKKTVDLFAELFQIFLVDLLSAERTLTLRFNPLFNALGVEVVFDVAA